MTECGQAMRTLFAVIFFGLPKNVPLLLVKTLYMPCAYIEHV